jgi:hypothetical protein
MTMKEQIALEIARAEKIAEIRKAFIAEMAELDRKEKGE